MATPTKVEQAFDQLRGYFQSLSLECSGTNVRTALGEWVIAAAKGWIASGCGRESLVQELPALEQIIRDFVNEALEFAAEDIESAHLELAGKLKKGHETGCAAEIVAADPALRRLRTWLNEQGVN